MGIRLWASFLFSLLYLHQLQAQTETPPDWLTASELMSKAAEYYDQDRLDLAIQQYEKGWDKDTGYCRLLIAKSYLYYQNDQYRESIEAAREALNRCEERAADAFELLAISSIESDAYDQAIAFCEKGLKRFPYNTSLQVNKAIAQRLKGDLNEAFSTIGQLLEWNPYYAPAHFQLGKLCAQNGMLTEATMAIDLAIIISNNSQAAVQYMIFLDELLSGKQEIPSIAKPIDIDDDFSKLTAALKSLAALNSKYKVDSKFTFPLIKQNGLLLEKLSLGKRSKGYFGQNYLPFFEQVVADDNAEMFFNVLMVHSDNEDVVKKLKKKADDVLAYRALLKDRWFELNSTIVHPTHPERGIVRIWVNDDNEFEGYGGHPDSLETNYLLTIFHPDGWKQREGRVINEKTQGTWKYYTLKGLQAELQFNEGVPHGQLTRYYPSGAVEGTGSFKEGERDGAWTDYYEDGTPSSETVYKDGVLHGDMRDYHANGQMSFSYRKENGEYVGEVMSYNAAGQLYRSVTARNGMANGPAFDYFANGKIDSERSYKDDLLQGPYLEYYANGNKYLEGQYEQDLKIGKWKTYNLAGQLVEENSYNNKGELHGEQFIYDDDGSKTQVYQYKNGEVESYSCFDRDGKLMHQGKTKGDVIEWKSCRIRAGQLSGNGMHRSGKREGEWQFIDNMGLLHSDVRYEEGNKEGRSLYYHHGIEWKRENYRKDTLQGWMNQKHLGFNTPYLNLYFVDGEAYGPTEYLEPDGAISFRADFANGGQRIYRSNHYADGQMRWEEWYNTKGNEIAFRYYGPDGQLWSADSLDKPNDTIRILYPNGKVKRLYYTKNYYKHGPTVQYTSAGQLMEEGHYLLDELHGKWVNYHFNGTVSDSGHYYLGEKNGTWHNYNQQGKLISKSHYVFGVQDGEQWEYHLNGKPSVHSQYVLGALHGATKVYAHDGQLQLHQAFILGRLVAFGNGNAEQLTPFDGLNGRISSNYPDGKKAVDFEMKEGASHGTIFYYHPNGQKESEGEDYYGQRNGTVKTYHPNGKLAFEGQFAYGTRHGKSAWYDSNGQLIEEQEYRFGDDYGPFKFRNAKGKMVEGVRYLSFVLINE